MSDIIAYCGLLCNECPAYKATVHNDNELREMTAKEWRKMFNPDIKAEDVNCLGCKSDLVFGYCKTCDIRACSSGKSLDTCAGCASYGCDKLEEMLQYAPNAKERLDKLRV
ncbi:DUF3795 domain-containing protein [Acetivibrio cellulolyticus]|uniref:DUF3795 domain-containing protein n=1 Tax=Acetivibrio cellulolyticus TaxID=35830 RepID=UPI0001E2F645|nr:DUF3795 domain-containing protein [Acetivibrio cellulolyticus]